MNEQVRHSLRLAAEVRHRVGSLALDVSFQISSWPAVLFGPSGAGKSTLLRILSGLLKPDRARLYLDDDSLRCSPGSKANLVQFVTQRPALFPHLNVAHNVAFGLERSTASERMARLDEMLALVRAEDLRHRMPQQLSGGESQRVAIARALAPAPRLLLLDEAFAGLDIAAKEELLDRLTVYFRQHAVASLHVTHEIEDAFALNAHVVVLRNGKVAAEGPVQTALAKERERLMTLLATERLSTRSPY